MPLPAPHDQHSPELIRAYKTWPGSNVFGLRGRLIFGPDARSLWLTVLMIVPPVAVFCAFVARKLMDDFPDHWGIAIMVCVIILTLANVIFLLLTSVRDPGIVPRHGQPPEVLDPDESSQNGISQNSQTRFRRTKEVVVNGMAVQIKYCDTCMHYRPPRCSHCSICDNCVERFDHHCPWVGQCIGARNYRFYFLFVLSATLLCIYIFAFCWIYVVRIMHGEKTTVWKALIKTPASIALIIYSFLAIWFVGGLTVFHTYLISRNQTTYENFRALYDQRANPYNRGMFGNFKGVFLSSIPPSQNNFRAKIRKEPNFPSRRVDNSFVFGSISGKASIDIEMGKKQLHSWEEYSGELSSEVGDGEGHGSKKADSLDAANGLTPQRPAASPAEGSGGSSRSETQPW